MSENVGRNDPCPCGSGKKYKQCCISKKQPKTTFGGRKFTAKVISAGGVLKPKPQQPEEGQEGHQQVMVDYNMLMERSFGQAIHNDEAPPVPENPSEYLQKGQDE